MKIYTDETPDSLKHDEVQNILKDSGDGGEGGDSGQKEMPEKEAEIPVKTRPPKKNFRHGPAIVIGAAILAVIAVVAFTVPWNEIIAEKFNQRGQLRMNQGSYEDAISLFDRAIRFNKNHFNAHQSRAVTFRLMGNYQESVDACMLTLERFPGSAITYCSMGWAYEYLEMYEEAVEAHLEAIRLSPDWPFPKQRLAETLTRIEGEQRETMLDDISEVDENMADWLRKDFKAVEARERVERDGRWQLSDDTVTDVLTHTVWQRTSPEKAFQWNQAEEYCRNLSLDGHDDWRLPKIQELRSLIKGCPDVEKGGACQVYDPDCLETGCWSGVSCGNCQYQDGPGENGCYLNSEIYLGACGWYWSSSLLAGRSSRGWRVNFNFGNLRYASHDLENYVRCIRNK